MAEATPITIPIGAHFKLSTTDESVTLEDEFYMKAIPYQSTVGNLMYAMICTRANTAYGVSLVSRFMSKPGKDQQKATKWILRYLKGSIDVDLKFTGLDCSKFGVEGYCDSDYTCDLPKEDF